MTRKDHDLITKAIRRTRLTLLDRAGERIVTESNGGCIITHRNLSELFDHTIVTIIDDLAQEFRVENPHFDRDSFERACLPK